MTGEQIRRARQRAKIGLRALAAHMGISPAYLCDLEWGRRKSQAQIDRAAIGVREMISQRRKRP
jgi:predicted transcriptional regulator